MKAIQLYITLLFLLLSRIYSFSQEADLIIEKNTYCLEEDKEGNIWVGTPEGILKINSNNFSYKQFTTQDGLPNNDVWDLYIDSSNRVWYFSKSNFQGYIQNDTVYKFKDKYDNTISPIAYYSKGDKVYYIYNTGEDTSYCFIHLEKKNGVIYVVQFRFPTNNSLILAIMTYIILAMILFISRIIME